MHDTDCADSCPACPCPSPLHLNETRRAKYIGLNACGYVLVPEWHCNACDAAIRPDFISLGLFPGTPQYPETLYSLEVLEQLEFLKLQGDTSTTSYLEGLGELHGRWACDEH
eukprot:1064928-Pelagomonas_calceolata.AAC.1